MTDEIRAIPINLIEVLNPRDRDEQEFSEIAKSIRTLGLKKPVVVTPRQRPDGSEYFLLVCGEGRLLVIQHLGDTTIPALVKKLSDEDAFLMSLSENIARRRATGRDRLWPIQQLRNRGYSDVQIAEKTGLSVKWIKGMMTLMVRGEAALLEAVDKGDVPLGAAITIVGAGNDSDAAQKAMHRAYASGALSSSQLVVVRRVLEARQAGILRKVDANITPSTLVRTLMNEVKRKQSLVRQAAAAQRRLAVIAESMRRLIQDENFVNLLRAEGLDSMPACLVDRLHAVAAVL